MPNHTLHPPLAALALVAALLADVQAQPPRPAFSVAASLTHAEALAGAHDVQLQGPCAFVAGKGGSLAVVDVANPRAPKLLWHRHDPDALEDCETVLPLGHHLLVGTRDFLVFDIRNPRSPALRATVANRPTIDHINGLVRRGSLVLAANKRGWIDCFDVADPETPRLVGALEVRRRHGLSSPHDIDAFDDYAVIVDGATFGRKGRPGRLAVLRIAERTTHGPLPVEQWTLVGVVESAALAGANRLQIAGRHAFVGTAIAPEARTGGRTGQGLVIDLSDPARPKQVAAHAFSDTRGPTGLTVAGNVCFLAGGRTVEALDISTPAAPQKLAAFRLPGASPETIHDAHDLVYREGHLYVTCQGNHSLVILKVDDAGIRKLAE